MKYIILGNGNYLKYALNDIIDSYNISYIDFETTNSKLNPLFEKTTLSPKVPGFIKRFLWEHCQNIFGTTNDEITFIIYERNRYASDLRFLKYLRKIYPHSYFVYYFTNYITDQWLKNNEKKFDFIKNTNLYDLKITFNKSDAERYGFEYFGHVNSTYKVEPNINANETSDVFFCGRAKERLNEIVDVYNKLTEEGLNCDFRVVTNVDKSIVDGIRYYKNTIPYSEIISGICCSNCILDITNEPNEDGQSLRLSEAIAYQKMLLTNNMHIVDNELYNSDQVVVFKEPNQINIGEMKGGWTKKNYRNPLDVSPQKLLAFIEEKLNDI